MKYDILAVYIHRAETGQYSTAVAWQASDDPRSWRVTYDVVGHLPTAEDMQHIVKLGYSMIAQSAVKQFPRLPADCVED